MTSPCNFMLQDLFDQSWQVRCPGPASPAEWLGERSKECAARPDRPLAPARSPRPPTGPGPRRALLRAPHRHTLAPAPCLHLPSRVRGPGRRPAVAV